MILDKLLKDLKKKIKLQFKEYGYRKQYYKGGQ